MTQDTSSRVADVEFAFIPPMTARRALRSFAAQGTPLQGTPLPSHDSDGASNGGVMLNAAAERAGQALDMGSQARSDVSATGHGTRANPARAQSPPAFPAGRREKADVSLPVTCALG